MAENKKKPPTEKEKLYAKKVITRLIIMCIVLTAVCSTLVFMGFTYLIVMVVVSILPAMVASIVDRRPRKHASKTVICFNLAGLFPSMFDIMMSTDPDVAAQQQLADPFTWLMVYGFAGFGWLVVYLIPQMVFLYLVVRSDHSIAKLEKKRKDLVEEWGERVKGGNT